MVILKEFLKKLIMKKMTDDKNLDKFPTMQRVNCTVKPVLSGHSKKRQKLFFKTDYRLKQVKSIAECSIGAFCNTLVLLKATICL